MMQRIRQTLFGVFACLLAVPAGSAMADTLPSGNADLPKIEKSVLQLAQMDRRRGNFDRFAQRQPERRISASQAKSAAQRRYPGAKFVNVQMAGRDTYRVRLQQKNGRIVDVYVDARTGRVKN